MVHIMSLNSDPFEKILSGRKNVELRVFDDKRRGLEIRDKIIFAKNDDSKNFEEKEKVAVKIIALYRYASFLDLFKEIPPEECGNAPGTTVEEAAVGMRKYYSEEREKPYGVLGIRIEIIDLEETLKQLEEEEEARFEWIFPDGIK